MTAAEPESDHFSLQRYFTPAQGGGRLRRFPRLAGSAFRIVAAAARRELIEILVMQGVAAGALLGQLLLLRSLLAHLVTGHSPTFSGVVPQLIGLAALTILTGTLATVLGLRSRLLSQLVAQHAIDAVARTAAAVDLITFETPAFFNRLHRAQLAASSRPALMVQELIGLAGAMLSIGAIAVTLVILQPLFCLLIFIAYVPIWLATRRASSLGYQQSLAQTERERKRQYLFQTLTSREGAQEIRAFASGSFLADRQQQLYATILAELRAVLSRRMRLALAGQALSGLLSAGVLALLVWFVTSGRMSLSVAGSAAGAMVLLGGRLHTIAGSSAGLYENSLYLEDYLSFVDASPAVPQTPGERSRPFGSPQRLSAEHVSFRYPSSARPCLEDVSLSVARGEIIALVGENGSGKTTCAKLLSGLYTPTVGAVTADGISLEEIDQAEVRENVAVIFQDFMRYLLPAHDNIALGDVSAFDDIEKVRAAARAAGIDEHLATLASGYGTILGPSYFGGSDLSGGQWQRIALARLFFRDAPFVLLDEPTASLDPRAESQLYEAIRSFFPGRGVLIISHRFGSVRRADRIYVLRHGAVVENGTHEQLIGLGGYYAELYELQARHYRD